MLASVGTKWQRLTGREHTGWEESFFVVFERGSRHATQSQRLAPHRTAEQPVKKCSKSEANTGVDWALVNTQCSMGSRGKQLLIAESAGRIVTV